MLSHISLSLLGFQKLTNVTCSIQHLNRTTMLKRLLNLLNLNTNTLFKITVSEEGIIQNHLKYEDYEFFAREKK